MNITQIGRMGSKSSLEKARASKRKRESGPSKKEGRARRAEEDSPKQEAPSSLPQVSNPRDEVIFY